MLLVNLKGINTFCHYTDFFSQLYFSQEMLLVLVKKEKHLWMLVGKQVAKTSSSDTMLMKSRRDLEGSSQE